MQMPMTDFRPSDVADGLDPIDLTRLRLTEDGKHFARIPTPEQMACSHKNFGVRDGTVTCIVCGYKAGLLPRRREDGSAY